MEIQKQKMKIGGLAKREKVVTVIEIVMKVIFVNI